MNKTNQKQDNLSLDEIVTAGLCMGCGLCRSIAGSDRVEIAMTPEGRERPIELRPLDEKTLDAIDATCPGIRVPSAEPESIPEGAETDTVWGPATQMAIGYATEPEIRHRGSSGGVLTALATYLLERKEVDFILHVAASKERPIASEPRLSFDAVSVLEASGSRYGPGHPLIDFMEVLDLNRPFAVVGKPCDITAIRNLERRDSRVKQLVRYCLSLICGGMSDLSKMLSVLDQFGVRETVLHEPFLNLYYFSQWRRSDRFGDNEQHLDYGTNQVMEHIKSQTKPVCFMKDMAYQTLPYIDRHFLNQPLKHTFLVRNPKKSLLSWYRLNEFPTAEEFGFDDLKALWQIVIEENQPKTIVVDADRLQSDPENTFKSYCQAVGIEFYPEMLSWKEERVKQDSSHKAKVFSPWHQIVENSTGILPPTEPVGEIRSQDMPMLERAMETYNSLSQFALK